MREQLEAALHEINRSLEASTRSRESRRSGPRMAGGWVSGVAQVQTLQGSFLAVSKRNFATKHETAQTQPGRGGGLRLCKCRRSRSRPCEAVTNPF